MQNKTLLITRTGILLALTVVMQYLGSLLGSALTLGLGTQLLVGSLVNMMLFLTTLYCGILCALVVSFLAPIIAYLFGIMKVALPIVIPFVGLGNALLCCVFYSVLLIIKGKRLISLPISVVISAAIKFVFLALVLTPILSSFSMDETIISALTIIFGVTQLETALIGGVLFFSVYLILNKAKIKTATEIRMQANRSEKND